MATEPIQGTQLKPKPSVNPNNQTNPNNPANQTNQNNPNNQSNTNNSKDLQGMNVDNFLGNQQANQSALNNGGKASSDYGGNVDKFIMSKDEQNARYYNGGQPNEQTKFGSSTNVKSDVVAKDMVQSVKENWNSVDPETRKMYESGAADKFFGDKATNEFKSLAPWQKAAAFELGKASFETASTFDPNHKDPGNQAAGNLSLYNKDSNFKNYGLKGDLANDAKNKDALTSPGFGVVADLNTTKQSRDLQQPGDFFDKNKDPLDKAHSTFVGLFHGKQEYDRQKAAFTNAVMQGGDETARNLQSRNIIDFIKKNS
jgi:hypothetical protein